VPGKVKIKQETFKIITGKLYLLPILPTKKAGTKMNYFKS
jgi:hypothetical protein